MQKTSPPELFSEKRIMANIRRAARINKPDADFLAQIASDMICERLNVTNREFPIAIDLFSRSSCMTAMLKQSSKVHELTRLGNHTENTSYLDINSHFVEMSAPLPLEKQSINLAASLFGLHWSNDLPGMFSQIRNSLAPDGLFLCVLPGSRTLVELRECLMEAEASLSSSASLRIDPFGEVRQFGDLLQRAGFTLPVVDSELLTVRYDCVRAIIEDLRAMGTTSTLAKPTGFGPRKLFEETDKIYQERFMDPDGRIRATFELTFLSGWAPHQSQQKPLKPGSAKNHLKDFLKSDTYK